MSLQTRCRLFGAGDFDFGYLFPQFVIVSFLGDGLRFVFGREKKLINIIREEKRTHTHTLDKHLFDPGLIYPERRENV